MKQAALASGSHAPALLHQALASQAVAEFVLASGYDGVIVDLQHGEIGLDDACRMLRALPREKSEYAYARVGSIDAAVILRLLDSGARGIIAPTVETAEQASRLVAATKYPPLGSRSLGPSRPALYPGQNYTAAGNSAVSTVVQIETCAGLENADAIFAVEGIDSVYIGPADLAVSYGLPGRGDWDDGPVRDAVVELSAKARTAGLTLGIYCASAEYARGLLDDGLVDYVGLGIDLVFLNTMARSAIKALRSEQWATTPTS
ncbi:HpcH/HpaI aldolase/citrate lyase family protein [Sinomonas sp. R1AF57]|uniref:HpcH/HpaI aldolase family protein n=1 Tax=Sinomonas sp. R1AF57 TaxID=2020377 RepID=UPI000B60D1DB|nr:aldolase/citrate lyase family protein [Sinomonas sp. R1AF57]ASN53389.1 aldolase [Sinomonas sp. R1AF57]